MPALQPLEVEYPWRWCDCRVECGNRHGAASVPYGDRAVVYLTAVLFGDTTRRGGRGLPLVCTMKRRLMDGRILIAGAPASCWPVVSRRDTRSRLEAGGPALGLPYFGSPFRSRGQWVERMHRNAAEGIPYGGNSGRHLPQQLLWPDDFSFAVKPVLK